jgi:hypothetical protein
VSSDSRLLPPTTPMLSMSSLSGWSGIEASRSPPPPPLSKDVGRTGTGAYRRSGDDEAEGEEESERNEGRKDVHRGPEPPTPDDDEDDDDEDPVYQRGKKKSTPRPRELLELELVGERDQGKGDDGREAEGLRA